MKINYEKETLHAYQSDNRAQDYKDFHTKQLSWGRFVTFIEHQKIAKELRKHSWASSDRLLDIPCGTGILGKLLHDFHFKITASDISTEMMGLARDEYPTDYPVEFKQADITNTEFQQGYFSCVITLGFLHRVPLDIKKSTLQEIYRLTSKAAIISCSVDTPLQRLKHKILSIVKPNHVPAPCPATLKEIIDVCQKSGFRVKRSFMVLPLLSSDALLVLEK